MNDHEIIKPLDDGKKKILSLDEAMKQLSAYQPSKPAWLGAYEEAMAYNPEQGSRASGKFKFYFGLEWEPTAPRMADGTKQSFTFDKSLERLKAAGYQRHPRPIEVFSLIIDHLNGELAEKPHLDAIAKDILQGEHEWLSLAMERLGDKLICYLDPENLVWRDDLDHTGYGFSGAHLKYNKVVNFDIPVLPYDRAVNLDKLDDYFVYSFYGKTFDKLPKKMQRKGAFRAQIWLPPLNHPPVPVCISGGARRLKFSVGAFPSCASRGVRLKNE